jgi:predicted FMN-binding regulatory protein PaiB
MTYPPTRHCETNIKKLYKIIEEFSLATVISCADNQPFITHAPLVLNRDSNMLFGHMDRSNPHAAYLNKKDIQVVFHGPNAYISPYVYKSSHLPTWNYIIVHVKGSVTEITSEEELLEILVQISKVGDKSQNAYILNKEDQRIGKMIDYIIGFSIKIESIIGRFKLSQDRDMTDIICAKNHLIEKNMESHKDLINYITEDILSNRIG